MKANRGLLLISFLAILVFTAASCVNNSSTITSTGDSTSISTSISTHISTSSTTPTSTSPSSTSLTTELPFRTDATMSLSGTPKLNETIDLTLTLNIIKSDDKYQPAAGLANAKAWLSFLWTNTEGSYSEAYSVVSIPAEEVIVGGELPWKGSYSSGLMLHSKIKLPREGIWSIASHFSGEGWLTAAGNEIRVAVADGTAAIMGTEDFKKGPLAYMGNLTREGGVSPPVFTYEMIPVTLGLNISKAPRVGEEVTLICRITSVIDVPDASIAWSFYRRLGNDNQEIPASELLSSADLGWKTDVRKGEPVVFSTTFKFPTEGDWEIAVSGKSGTKYLTQSGHRMKISITSTRSSFGWVVPPPLHQTTIPETGVKAIYLDKPTGPSPTEPQPIGNVTGPVLHSGTNMITILRN